MNPAFDSATLAGVVAELQALVGAKVQRVSQPEELQAVLSIFKPGVGEKHLLFDVSPRFYRAKLTGQRWRNPPSPPAFCAAAAVIRPSSVQWRRR